jgi:t-SNARE complex subunit (syntaxin)
MFHFPYRVFDEGLDNIESNITSVAVDTGAAATELTTAHEYQRKAGRRAACLMIVFALVICIVLLAVSTTLHSRNGSP